MLNLERYKLLKAMDIIARYVNNESFIEEWLANGVPDGDINIDNISVSKEELENLSYYSFNNHFKDAIDSFMEVIINAYEDGGLYCDSVVGGCKDEN